MSGNLDIWNQVEATNPEFTKGFSRSGGFKGTATNVVYLAKKATYLFGPVGIGWGWTVVDDRIIDGHDIVKIHIIRLKVWYMWKGQRGEVEHFGQTEMVGKNKYGPFTDEEAPKKSLTDALSKCLSMLGFSADIFMGLYDDSKYVSAVKRDFASGQEFADPIDIPRSDVPAPAAEAKPNPVSPDPLGSAEQRTADELYADILRQIDGFTEHGQVTLFMTNKAVKPKLKSLGSELEERATAYAKARYSALKEKMNAAE